MANGTGIHHSIKPNKYTICVANQYYNRTTKFLLSYTDWEKLTTSTKTFVVSKEGKIIKIDDYTKNIVDRTNAIRNNEAYQRCEPYLKILSVDEVPRLAIF